jgi:hypothetical protein
MTLYPYSSTHRIERTPLGHLRKDLSVQGRMAEAAQQMRPRQLEDPTREPSVYRSVLSRLGIGPRLISSGTDWVVLDPVDGVELWQIGNPDVWVDVAGWLAGLHEDLRRADFEGVPLAEYDPVLFDLELESAGEVPGSVRLAHPIACHFLEGEPRGVVHGDMYPSNLLIAAEGPPVRVVPLDWEMAGRGPAVLDLAALTAGGWSDDVRDAMAEAYFARAGSHRQADWRPRIDAAVLQVCLRWMGANKGWEPPVDHRQDWTALADQAARRLLDGRRG